MRTSASPQYPPQMNAAADSPEPVDWEALYASELPVVYAFLHRLGARGGDLEDLAHDVFVTVVRRWKSFDPSRPLRPWLLGITYRVMQDFLRRASTQREVVTEPPEEVDPGEGAERAVAQREAKALLEEALKSLAPERRAVFVMYELEELSVADISEAMGVPPPTTYSRLRVAREEFQAAVKRIQLRRAAP